jgi:hypothetical protein
MYVPYSCYSVYMHRNDRPYGVAAPPYHFDNRSMPSITGELRLTGTGPMSGIRCSRGKGTRVYLLTWYTISSYSIPYYPRKILIMSTSKPKVLIAGMSLLHVYKGSELRFSQPKERGCLV